MEIIVVSDGSAFAFETRDLFHFAAVELQAYTRAAAIFRDEHHAKIFQSDADGLSVRARTAWRTVIRLHELQIGL